MKIRVTIDGGEPFHDGTYVYDSGEIARKDVKTLIRDLNAYILSSLNEQGKLFVRGDVG